MKIDYSALTLRKKEFKEFVAFQHLEASFKNLDLSYYYFNLPLALSSSQETLFLLDEEIFKEDYGTFKFLNDIFKAHSEADIDDADFLILPVNINFYHSELASDLLRKIIYKAQSVAGSKKIILFSIGDFCLRSEHRNTTFEKQLFTQFPDLKKKIFPYLRPQDSVICFESTPDLVQLDFPIFPLAHQAIVPYFTFQKRYLYSFVGEFYKEGWPEGFVRSPSRRDIWESLRKLSQKNGLIISTLEALSLIHI